MSLNSENTISTFAGILTFIKGIAMMIYKVWKVPHNILNANEKNIASNR